MEYSISTSIQWNMEMNLIVFQFDINYDSEHRRSSK